VPAAIAFLAVAGYAAYLALTSAVRDEALPSAVDGFTDECTSSKPVAFPAAARYAGPGPHPIIIQADSGNTDPGAGIAAPWQDQPAPWRPSDPRAVQLIACGTVTKAAAQAITTCTFGNSLTGVQSAPMYPGLWHITVYAARTGLAVGHVQLVGDSTICPDVNISQNGQPTPVYSGTEVTQLRAALGRYVG
jgi:hypothetical protein